MPHKDKNKIEEECIIAMKVYDQAKQKVCDTLGPVLSAEKCDCLIVKSKSKDEYYSSIITPGKPINLPKEICNVKIDDDCFKIIKIDTLDVDPSPYKKGFWDVIISFTFKFKIYIFDAKGNRLKVICCPFSEKGKKREKDFLYGKITYIKKVTMFGSSADDLVIASDIFPFSKNISAQAPHTLVEAKAYAVDVKLEKPDKGRETDDVFDNIYEDPIVHLYVTIGLYCIIKLFRIVNLSVQSKGFCMLPEDYEDKDKAPCDLFYDLDFPNNEFAPPDR